MRCGFFHHWSTQLKKAIKKLNYFTRFVKEGKADYSLMRSGIRLRNPQIKCWRARIAPNIRLPLDLFYLEKIGIFFFFYKHKENNNILLQKGKIKKHDPNEFIDEKQCTLKTQ